MSLLDELPHPFDADAFFEAFSAWAARGGLELYPAQEEAMIGLVSDAHVILSTPTGTGKSLVALGAHALALAQGRRSAYTAPIKALVSEKFFALVDTFGADRVGMVTGDTHVNTDAPILCCTAEILANQALRHGPQTPFSVVVMDEFHYYGDPERGWAWQVPLLEMTGSQFLLMSATLGDTTAIAADLSSRTGRETVSVTGVERPVPLSYRYVATPVHETVRALLDEALAPLYLVHFSQAAAVEAAQALAGAGVATRAQRDGIAEAIGAFRFQTGFGRTLSRLLRLGVGVHHAGMLPGYRRLVEQLAQKGLLPVICGTDTLGVGINVPIRTVVLTALTKFDGVRTRRLRAREFHQIAGRAGRAGFDDAGDVVALAPEHEIENQKALAKAAGDPKKKHKITRKKPPAGFVSWNEATFTKLIEAQPEELVPRLRMTHAMVINVIARGGDVYRHLHSLVFDNHEPWRRQLALARRALGIYRSLLTGGVVEKTVAGPRLTLDLQPDFALNQPLSPFALAAFELLDPASESHAVDVVSIIESILDDPRAVLAAQQYKARGQALAEMKAEGTEYEERMERLEAITWPKPLDELIGQAFATYSQSQPWAKDFEPSPKSVVRDMHENAMTFAEYVSWYGLTRSEGVLLRYLSDAYRALRQSVPPALTQRDPALADLVAWLGELVRQVDSSLVDEWEELAHPDAAGELRALPRRPDAPLSRPAPVTANRHAFTVLLRNAMFRLVLLASRGRLVELHDAAAPGGPDAAGWQGMLAAYGEEHDEILTGAPARGPQMLQIDTSTPGLWRLRQVVDDPEGDRDWAIEAEADLAASDEAGEPVLRVAGLVRLDR
ncbi:MAG TPA: DUF3516 domain-containing protein [Microbacteriaceae bacterium]|nr:DUF3516 domain-containing protein [Microbacteriaceae bacterium]